MTSTFLSNVRRLLAGSGLAQAIQFASLLLLSRIYEPNEFGLLAQVQSIATALTIFVTLQLHLVIPLAKSDVAARRAVATSRTICVVGTLVALPIASLIGSLAITALMLSAALGLSNTGTGYLVYRADFRALSRFYIARALFIVVLQFAFGALAVDYGLVLGSLVGETMAAAYLTRLVRPIRLARFAVVVRMLHRWSSFATHGTLQEVTSVLAFYAPLFWFAARFGDDVAGQYSLANRLVWAPVVLLSTSVAHVLYQQFGSLRSSGQQIRINKRLSIAVLVVLCLVTIVAGQFQGLFAVLLGPNWLLASQLIPLNLLWGAIFLASTPYRVACRVLELQRYKLSIDLVTLGLISLAFAQWATSPIIAMWVLAGIAFAQHGSLVLLISRRLTNARSSSSTCTQ